MVDSANMWQTIKQKDWRTSCLNSQIDNVELLLIEFVEFQLNHNSSHHFAHEDFATHVALVNVSLLILAIPSDPHDSQTGQVVFLFHSIPAIPPIAAPPVPIAPVKPNSYRFSTMEG